jgi:hypothetical protein
MKVCSYCGRENDAGRTVCQECGVSLPGTEGTGGAPPKPVIACPACGVQNNYKASIALRGSFSWLIFFLGGLLAILFHNASRQRRFQCNACGAFFGVRTPLSKLWLFVLWLLIAPTIILFVFIFMSSLFSR